MFARLSILNAFFAFAIVFNPQYLLAIAADKLDVGSVAPKLNVEHWVQDGAGKFPKVTSFVCGQVYVEEFWETTCGPCVQSMPHGAEIQKNHADKGIQIVSISNEPLEVIKEFLQTELTDEQGSFKEFLKELQTEAKKQKKERLLCSNRYPSLF